MVQRFREVRRWLHWSRSRRLNRSGSWSKLRDWLDGSGSRGKGLNRRWDIGWQEGLRDRWEIHRRSRREARLTGRDRRWREWLERLRSLVVGRSKGRYVRRSRSEGVVHHRNGFRSGGKLGHRSHWSWRWLKWLGKRLRSRSVGRYGFRLRGEGWLRLRDEGWLRLRSEGCLRLRSKGWLRLWSKGRLRRINRHRGLDRLGSLDWLNRWLVRLIRLVLHRLRVLLLRHLRRLELLR